MAYTQITLAQLQAYFYEQVGGNQAFWRPNEVTAILQESLRVFNVLTGFWRGRVDGGLTAAGAVYYAVPAGLSYILRVEINGQQLESSSLWDLDYGRPGWENEVCVAGQQPNSFAPVGTNLFALWPASLAGGESIKIDGVVAAPMLSAVGTINLGQDELESILDYAQHVAQFKEGGQEFEASQESLKEFLKEAGERNGVLCQSAKFRTWMGLSDQKKRPMRMPDVQVGAR
jgi:hypothetical protein